MPTVLLVRHGVTAANVGGTLAGWTPGVDLDDTGREQARALASRVASIPVAAIATSPLERCQQTAAAIAAGREVSVEVDERLGEAKYGDWTGQSLKTLAKDKLWRVVQAHPSAARFPAGESLAELSARAVAAIRERNAALDDGATWLAVSHGDVIKAIVADALGVHLDMFQRIVIDPCSLTVVRYTELRPFVLRLNDTGDLSGLLPPKRKGRRVKASSDAVVGGGAGAQP